MAAASTLLMTLEATMPSTPLRVVLLLLLLWWRRAASRVLWGTLRLLGGPRLLCVLLIQFLQELEEGCPHVLDRSKLA
jgi:hypothetical protein